MVRYRARIAIGTFATTSEVEAMIGRLRALGITRYETVWPSSGQTSGEPVRGLQGSEPGPSEGTSGIQALRIHLITPEQEQAVAAALLASAAKSVQLHDIDETN